MEKQAKEQAQQYLEQTKQMIDSGVSDFKERMKEMADMLFDQEKVNEILNGDKHEKEFSCSGIHRHHFAFRCDRNDHSCSKKYIRCRRSKKDRECKHR